MKFIKSQDSRITYPDSRIKLEIKIILFLLLLIWNSGIYIEFIAPHFNSIYKIYPFVKKAYSLVCHQEADKLISLNGMHTMVCARCAGIYLGLFGVSLLSFFFSMKKRINISCLFIATAPMLLDVIFVFTGLYNYSKNVAFITGFLLGSVGFIYLYYGLENLIVELKIKHKEN